MVIFPGFVGQTIFMVIAAYTMTPTSAVTCLTFAVGIGGFAWAGFGVNPLDIAPQVGSLLKHAKRFLNRNATVRKGARLVYHETLHNI